MRGNSFANPVKWLPTNMSGRRHRKSKLARENFMPQGRVMRIAPCGLNKETKNLCIINQRLKLR